MEELSTPVEAVVEDTSVAQEPVETTDVTTDTSDTVTEPETTTNEPMAETTTEGEQAPAETVTEKLYAGKYKSIEDLEKGYKEAEKSFNRVAELEKQLKAYEEQKPKYVDDTGKINPEIKLQNEIAGDNKEFLAYVDLARYLDNNSRTEVERLLTDAKSIYNPKNKQAYLNKLNEAKNYFNSDIIEAVANDKREFIASKQKEMANLEQKARQEKANYFANEIQKTPELYALVNPESAEYSPEVFSIVKSMFDAYNGIDIKQTMDAISKIKQLGVKEFQAKQTLEEQKKQAVINTGNKVTTQHPDLPSAKEVAENYQKYINKYMKDGMSFDDAMAKVDAIIMKG